MERTHRFRVLVYLVVFLLVALSLVETWLLVRRPWQVNAVIGGTDSALLGGGFFTKEVSEEGSPFRWTSSEAQVTIPWTQPAYRVILGAETAVTSTQRLELVGCGSTFLTMDVQPGFHYYHAVWPLQCLKAWPSGFGSAELLLVTPARQLSEFDDRYLGISVSELYVRSVGTGGAAIAPLLVIGLSVTAVAFLLRPWRLWRLLLLAGVALLLPLLFDLLAWHPPVGANYTWLPASWLPGLVAVALVGLVFVRTVLPWRYGPLVLLLLVGLLFLALLINLQVRWEVKGPDYEWHLNHGGSWARVFRSHAFYPFGFPLVLWLGQLWGDQALLLGRAACFLATVLSFVATVLLAWRLSDREGAWLGGLLFLASPLMIAYGVLASTDALAMAPALLALLVLCWSERPRVRHLLLGGLLLGIAYLFRYQAMVLLGAVALWLLGARIEESALPRRWRWLRRLGRFLPVILFLAGFLVGSAPQWILDIRDTGRPFFTRQYLNIWYYGYNWSKGVPPSPESGELWYILSFDPATLWRHWMSNLHGSVETTLHALLIWPLGLVSLLGLVRAVLDVSDRRYRLLFLWTTIYVLAVTLTANKERFFLPLVPVLVVLAVVFLLQVRDSPLAARKGYRFLYPALQVGLWCWVLLHLLEAEQQLAIYGSLVFP